MTQRIIDIISGKDTSLTASLTRGMLSLLTPGYAIANGVRQKLFDAERALIHHPTVVWIDDVSRRVLDMLTASIPGPRDG